MKKTLLLIFILTSFPVFAACPIDGSESACVADIQSNIFSPAQIQPQLPKSDAKAGVFTETPSNIDLSREIKPAKTRDFGSNNTEYGYNSSCQFGVCMDTGTPKIFSQDKN